MGSCIGWAEGQALAGRLGYVHRRRGPVWGPSASMRLSARLPLLQTVTGSVSLAMQYFVGLKHDLK